MRAWDLPTLPIRFALAAAISIFAAPGPLAGAEPETAEPPPAVSFDAAADAAASLPRLHSLLVSQGGKLVFEHYYNGARATRPVNIKSASKSIISALVGIAIDRGLIAGPRQPIAPFFPNLADLLNGEGYPRRSEITIEDLLSMRSGLETTSNRNYGRWVRSGNWVRHILSRPFVSLPGTSMEYSTGNTHLLSAILTKVTGTSTWQFAQESLARPLGFTLPRWPQDPQGIYFGGNDMLLTPRQMLAFGELYLNQGRSNGQQVIPAEWVRQSFVPRARSRREDDRFYGYGWWIRELAGQQTAYAWGFGGQFIFVVPKLDLVVVTTSATTLEDDRRSHRFTVLDLVEHLIIAPAAAQSAPASAQARPSRRPDGATALRTKRT
jgi:CubicO group peptidase (beta-lactamase class C family)